MSSSIAAITTGTGGVITTADNSGNLNLVSGTTTIVAVTSAGIAVTGTLTASGGIAGTSVTNKIQPITASVAASALTITLNPTVLDFRASPITSGTVTSIVVSVAISVVIPSTSTMGTVSAQQSRLAVIAINNAGTVELAAVNIAGGSVLDETTLINTTAAVAAGNSATAYYSTTARTGVAYRVVGYVESTQTTAGTWATAPSTIQGMGGQAVAAMSSFGFGQTWQTVTRTSGTTYYNTTGKTIMFSLHWVSGGSQPLNATVGGYSFPSLTSMASFQTGMQILVYTVPPGQSYSYTIAGTYTTLELR